MKCFLPLCLVAAALTLVSNAARAQETIDPEKTGPTYWSLVSYPAPPQFSEITFMGAAAITPGADSTVNQLMKQLIKQSGNQVQLAAPGPFASQQPGFCLQQCNLPPNPITLVEAPAKTTFSTRFAFQINYARGLFAWHSLALVAEFPVVSSPNGVIKSTNLSAAGSFSSLYFTPALRIVYAPDRKNHSRYQGIYPFISLGGGLAHFDPSKVNLAGGASGATSSTEGALQAGIGADFGIYKKSVALRTEIRDFYSASPNLGVPGANLRHNLVASAGIVFRFGYKKEESVPDEKKDPDLNRTSK